eukprot:gene8155-8997_t
MERNKSEQRFENINKRIDQVMAETESDKSQSIPLQSSSSEEIVSVTPFLIFSDKAHDAAFNNAFLYETPRLSFVVLTGLYSLWFYHEFQQALTTYRAGVLNLISPLAIFVIAAFGIYICANKRKHSSASSLANSRRTMMLLEESFATVCVSGVGIATLAHCMSAACDGAIDRALYSNAICSNEHRQYFLPLYYVPGLLLGVSAFAVVNTIVIDGYSSFNIVLTSIVFSFAGVYIKRYNRVTAYRTLHADLDEKDRILRANFEQSRLKLAELDAEEWRFVIANMAHDLQTPLAALRTGLEIISSAFEEMHRLLSRNAIDHVSVEEERASGENTARDLQSTLAYMTMTVHRTLDFIKAARGVELVPQMETIDLVDCLAAPLACLHDLQAQHCVDLLPVPSNIERTIVTDPRWLQESLLCFTSNAVKYSMNQPVTLRLRLLSPNFSPHELPGLDVTNEEEKGSSLLLRLHLKPSFQTLASFLQQNRAKRLYKGLSTSCVNLAGQVGIDLNDPVDHELRMSPWSSCSSAASTEEPRSSSPFPQLDVDEKQHSHQHQHQHHVHDHDHGLHATPSGNLDHPYEDEPFLDAVPITYSTEDDSSWHRSHSVYSETSHVSVAEISEGIESNASVVAIDVEKIMEDLYKVWRKNRHQKNPQHDIIISPKSDTGPDSSGIV